MNGFIMDSRFVTHNVAERVTGAIITTESDHTAIHKGYGYKGGFKVTNLSGGGEVAVSFTTPADKFVHFKNIKLNALGESCSVEFLKNPAITEDLGTFLPLVNQNDNFNREAGTEMRYNPAYTGGQVMVDTVVLIDSTNQSVGSGTSSMSLYEEIVLKPDTKYILRIRNLSPTDILKQAYVNFFFYEEPRGSFSG